MGVVTSGAKWNEEDTTRERRRWEEGPSPPFLCHFGLGTLSSLPPSYVSCRSFGSPLVPHVLPHSRDTNRRTKDGGE